MIGEEQKILCKEIGYDAALDSAYHRGYNAGQGDAFEAAASTRKDLQQRIDKHKGKIEEQDLQIGQLMAELAQSAEMKKQMRERINHLEDKHKEHLLKIHEQSKELVNKNNDLLEMVKGFEEWKSNSAKVEVELQEMIDTLKTEIRSLRAQMGRAGLKPAKTRKGR